MNRPKTCTVKGCSEPNVYAYLPGVKKDCCKAHGAAIIERQRLRRLKGQFVPCAECGRPCDAQLGTHPSCKGFRAHIEAGGTLD